MHMIFNFNSNRSRSTEVVVLDSDRNHTYTVEGDGGIFPIRAIVSDSCRNGIRFILIGYSNRKRAGNKLDSALNELKDVSKLNGCVVCNIVDDTLKLLNGVTLFSIKNGNAFKISDCSRRHSPAVAGNEVVEGQVDRLMVLFCGMLVLTTVHRKLFAVGINDSVSVRIGKIELGMRNTAELIVRRVRSHGVLFELTVVVIIPPSKMNGRILCADSCHCGNGIAIDVRRIMSYRTDDHTCIAVCVVLIVCANVVINVDLRRNVTVFKFDSVARRVAVTVNVSAVHTNKAAACNVPRAPKCAYLVGVVYGYILEGNVVVISCGSATCDTDDTAVSCIIYAGVRISNCDVCKGGIACGICCDNARGGKFTVGCEVIHSKVFNGTAVDVAEDTHCFLIVMTVVITLHLPGVLVDILDCVTVSVENAPKCASVGIPNAVVAVCNRSCGILRIVGILFVINKLGSISEVYRCNGSAFLVVTDRIEDYSLIYVLFSAQVYICNKLIVLVGVICIIV